MKEALLEAQKAFAKGEVPVGAVVVYEGQIVGRGHNQRESGLDISSHAEIEAMKNAAKTLGRWNLSDCTLYVTLEPCLMCAGAILQSGLFRVVYGAEDEQMGAICANYHVFDAPSAKSRPLVSRGVCSKECADLLQQFFVSLREK